VSKIVRIRAGGFPEAMVCALERLPEISKTFWPDNATEVTTPSDEPVDRAMREAAFKAWKGPDDESEALLASLLGEWLRAYGPVRPGDIGRALALDPPRLELALEDLKDSETVIEGALVKGSDSDFVCDAENYETLLRLERAALAPSFEPREVEILPQFLAQVQGLTRGLRAVGETAEEKAFRAVEQLVGYALLAHIWEAEILPTRVPCYATAQLDFALGQSDLRWQGSARKEVRFLFERDMDLIRPESGIESGAGPEPEPVAVHSAAALFSDPHARYDFGTLLKRAGGDIASLERRLWEGVWAGWLTNNTWSALRRGLQTKFSVGDVIARQKRSLEYAPRRESLRLSGWRESQAYPGSWLILPRPSPAGAEDLIEREEVRKDRVRLLLGRYGILFREILTRESPPFRWPDVFRTLRLMELSGEVLSGYFFKGIPGPQFMSHQAFRIFLKELPGDDVFWLSAVDPASACGLPLEGLRGSLPKRVEGTHLVYRGPRLVLVSQRNGRSLDFLAPPDDTRIPAYLGLCRHLLTREYAPLRRVIIETINGEPAPASPYLLAFRPLFDVVVDVKRVSLPAGRGQPDFLRRFGLRRSASGNLGGEPFCYNTLLRESHGLPQQDPRRQFLPQAGRQCRLLSRSAPLPEAGIQGLGDRRGHVHVRFRSPPFLLPYGLGERPLFH
jgi:ATP-dependent Lhr-like helicase